MAECLEMEERAEDPAQLRCTGVTITGIWWPLHRVEGVHGPNIDFALQAWFRMWRCGLWCGPVSRLQG